MYKNKTLRAWQAGEQTVGGWFSLNNVHVAEAMSSMGFSWLCLDLQHGLIEDSDMKHMLPALSTGSATPFVRVSWNNPHQIMRALDAGAFGVIVPMINSAEDARNAVASCRYPPDGIRSFGPLRAGLVGGRDYPLQANKEIACIGMIETAEGIKNLDEIVNTPGLDGIYIGPSDLALAIGLPAIGDNDNPEHQAVVEKIRVATRNAGIAIGIHTSSAQFCKKYLDQGFQFVNLGTDFGFLARAAREDLKFVKEYL